MVATVVKVSPMPRPKNAGNIAKARKLRQQMSLPEVLLWRILKAQPLAGFRRQHPIGPYVLDFYCPRRRLCVEIDGHSHDTAERWVRDERRDRWLAEHGIQAVRLAARDVLGAPDIVAEALVRMGSE